ncbi:MAG: hypothetical protein HRO68_07675 [Nitrosopumilus sp.]|nr:hypothetical protein [Nitrosopumilus sp.]
MAKKFSKLSKKELLSIAKLNKIQHDADLPDFEKHVKFIAKYCFENNLTSLSFKRTKKGGWNDDCSFYNPFDFMTIAQRKDVEKQLEELK